MIAERSWGPSKPLGRGASTASRPRASCPGPKPPITGLVPLEGSAIYEMVPTRDVACGFLRVPAKAWLTRGGRTEDEGEPRTASVEPCSPGIPVPHLATLGRFRSGRSNTRNGVSVGPEELPVALTAVRWTSAADDPGAQSPDHPDHDDQDQGPHAAAEGRVHVFLRPRPKKGRDSYRAQESHQDQSAIVHDPPFPKNDRRPKFSFPRPPARPGRLRMERAPSIMRARRGRVLPW